MNRKVKYYLGIIFGLASISGLYAQEVFTPVAGNPFAASYHSKVKRVMKSAQVDTLDLPFFDDFSATFVEPDQTIWTDNHAFVNNNYCIDPVTNGVATLDVLDFNGSIYPDATIDPNSFVADYLTSKPLRLSYSPGDSIYFSFLYQPRGLGDEPEEQDSLLVDFYRTSDSLWINVWGIPGTQLHDFKHVMIPITGDQYLTDGFRFRFRNRASLPKNPDYPDKRSNVDHWHLDYIRLDMDRFASDTILRDVAFITPMKSILKDLTSLPWSHFEDAFNTVLDQNIPVRYRNNDTISRNITRSLVVEEPLWGGSDPPSTPTAQDIPALQDTVVEFEYLVYQLDTERGDSAILRFKASLRTDEIDPKVNDTVFHDQHFNDYYSYDDGTAEAGYGLRGQGTKNGSVAVKYFVYTPDEIGGVDIAFNQVMDSVNLGYYFKLFVWEDNDGIPGSVLHEDEKDHLPGYPTYFPGFIRWHFDEPVQVEGTFYVGWKQYNYYLLNVGMDVNNRPTPHVTYYNYQGTWEESKSPGVLLIRPFLYTEPTGTLSRGTGYDELKIYPNPATDQVMIELPGKEQIRGMVLDVYDTSGRLAFQEIMQETMLDVSSLSSGIYYIRVSSGKTMYSAKLLIHR